MFVTRANPPQRLPSFSELMLSIASQAPLPHHLAFSPMIMPTEETKPQLVYTSRPTLTLQTLAMPFSPLPPALDPGASPLEKSGSELLLPLLVEDHRTHAGWIELTHHRSSHSKSPETDHSTSSVSSSVTKRKHACKTCGRLFTTLGHLARHNRTHTGERKHMCPWPQCEARFARQDNCMQHYKTHMNGKGKRNRLRR